MARWLRRDQLGYLLALSPATVMLALFFIFPALWAIYASMTNLDLASLGAAETRWVGFDNYRRLWNDPDFPMITRNTLLLVIGAGIVGQTFLGLLLALLLDHARSRRYRLADVALGLVLLATICPPALAGFAWGRMYDVDDGPINAALSVVAIGGVDWLGSVPMLSVIVAEVWRSVALAMLIFLAALHMIPVAVFEAARVDGAGAWARLRDVTLPLLRRECALVLVLTTILTTGSFVLILILTNGDPGRQTLTLSLYAFHNGYGAFDIGFGSAISSLLLVTNVAVAGLYFRLTRERQ